MNTVDVIVPCYNYGRFLPECVASILGQHGLSVRILILDDASTDDSFDIARDLAAHDDRISIIRHETNRGHIATYNEGLDWAEAEYMLLLSADDVLAPGSLQRAVDVMSRHPEVGLTYGRSIAFSGPTAPPAPHPAPDRPDHVLIDGSRFLQAVSVKPSNWIETATAVARTSAQKRVGHYRPELPHAGDFEMWLRFAATGRLAYIDTVQAFTRRHADNMRNSYAVSRMIGDFEQRSKALQLFFGAYAEVVPHSVRLSASARRKLAEEILWTAVRALEANEVEIVSRLARLATSNCPRIVLSTLWQKLLLRRLIGPRHWRRLAPWVDLIRRRYQSTDRQQENERGELGKSQPPCGVS